MKDGIQKTDCVQRFHAITSLKRFPLGKLVAPVLLLAGLLLNPVKSFAAYTLCEPSSGMFVVWISPDSIEVPAGGTTQFSAVAFGSSDEKVWSLSPSVGTISADGTYAAPQVVPTGQTVAVTLASAAAPGCKVQATVTVRPSASVSVSVSPQTTTLSQSGIQQFTARVTGTADQTVRWSLNPQIGNLSVNGSSAVYTAPSSFETSQTVELVVTAASGSATAKATISLVPTVTVTVTPASVTLQPGEQLQFTADVGGTPNKAATWSLQPALGTISQTGLYIAPADTASPTPVSVLAQSAANPAKRATASVQLSGQQALSYKVGNNGLTGLVYKGIDYNYLYGEGLLTKLYYARPDGTTYAIDPVCTKGVSSDIVTHRCSEGSHPVTSVAAFSQCGTDKVCVDLSVTNNDRADTISQALLSVFGLKIDNLDLDRSTYGNAVNIDSPVATRNFVTGQSAIWIEDPGSDKSMQIFCGYHYVCKQQPQIASIAPGQTKGMRVAMRLTSDPNASQLTLAPEAFSALRTALPEVIHWPDRRPIMSWFVGEVTKRSATNPRGYLQDAAIDVSDVPGFRNRVMAQATKVRDLMNARPVRPQGLIVWDLEGQEFIHSTTYVGDPRVFASGYAPEMNAVADDLFKVFKDAGYRVGVTLRPQYLQWGTQAPSACKFNTNHDFKDYFIKVDAPFKQKFFACYDPQGKAFSLIPDGNGGQTAFTKDQATDVLALLKSKVQYAKDRWGVTLFYVDSAVWSGGGPIYGDIFRSLQKSYPDSLFIPEQESLQTFTAGIPFADPKNVSDPRFSRVSVRWAYPTAAIAIRLPDCQGTCWNDNVDAFKIGQKVGDIALYNQPGQMSLTQLATIETMIQDSRREASSVVVTDPKAGRTFTFTGQPNSIAAYPMKMRVYFARSAAELASSTLSCETGQWVGENTCELDLTGIKISQIRYVDYTNTLVSSERPTDLN